VTLPGSFHLCFAAIRGDRDAMKAEMSQHVCKYCQGICAFTPCIQQPARNAYGNCQLATESACRLQAVQPVCLGSCTLGWVLSRFHPVVINCRHIVVCFSTRAWVKSNYADHSSMQHHDVPYDDENNCRNSSNRGSTCQSDPHLALILSSC